MAVAGIGYVGTRYSLFATGDGADGLGKEELLGECSEFTPPAITLRTEDRVNGLGFTQAQKLGYERVECTFVLESIRPGLFKQLGSPRTWEFLRDLSTLSDPANVVEKYVVTGDVVSVVPSASSPDGLSSTTVTMYVRSFKHNFDDEVVEEYNIDTGVVKSGDTDIEQTKRASLGLSTG